MNEAIEINARPDFENILDIIKNNKPFNEEDSLAMPESFGAWFEADCDFD